MKNISYKMFELIIYSTNITNDLKVHLYYLVKYLYILLLHLESVFQYVHT